MKIKKGVKLPAGVAIGIALQIIDPILREHNQELVLTSYLDGKHSKGSLHYVGLAIDLRTWDITTPRDCVREMQKALGEDFDVILERDHIHLEYQPK